MKSELRTKFEEILSKKTATCMCGYESLLKALGGIPIVCDKDFGDYYNDKEYGLKEIEQSSIYKSLAEVTKSCDYIILNCMKFKGLECAFDAFRTKYGNVYTNLKKTRNFHWKKELTLYSNSVYEYHEQITNPKASLNPGEAGFDTTIHFFVIQEKQLENFVEFM